MRRGRRDRHTLVDGCFPFLDCSSPIMSRLKLWAALGAVEEPGSVALTPELLESDSKGKKRKGVRGRSLEGRVESCSFLLKIWRDPRCSTSKVSLILLATF